jgi:hypothetical protein
MGGGKINEAKGEKEKGKDREGEDSCQVNLSNSAKKQKDSKKDSKRGKDKLDTESNTTKLARVLYEVDVEEDYEEKMDMDIGGAAGGLRTQSQSRVGGSRSTKECRRTMMDMKANIEKNGAADTATDDDQLYGGHAGQQR